MATCLLRFFLLTGLILAAATPAYAVKLTIKLALGDLTPQQLDEFGITTRWEVYRTPEGGKSEFVGEVKGGGGSVDVEAGRYTVLMHAGFYRPRRVVTVEGDQDVVFKLQPGYSPVKLSFKLGQLPRQSWEVRYDLRHTDREAGIEWGHKSLKSLDGLVRYLLAGPYKGTAKFSVDGQVRDEVDVSFTVPKDGLGNLLIDFGKGETKAAIKPAEVSFKAGETCPKFNRFFKVSGEIFRLSDDGKQGTSVYSKTKKCGKSFYQQLDPGRYRIVMTYGLNGVASHDVTLGSGESVKKAVPLPLQYVSAKSTKQPGAAGMHFWQLVSPDGKVYRQEKPAGKWVEFLLAPPKSGHYTVGYSLAKDSDPVETRDIKDGKDPQRYNIVFKDEAQ